MFTIRYSCNRRNYNFWVGPALSLAVAIVVHIADLQPAHAQDGMTIQLSQGQQLKASLPLGQSRTVDVGREIGEIVVGNPEVADVAPLTNQSLYVLGKTQGRTTITVYDAEKEPIGIIEVEVGVDLGDLRRAIRGVAPQANIQLSSANGRLRISGTVADAPTASRIMEIAEQFGSDQIINAMRVRTSQQVMLEVRFIEANRNAGRELGVDWLATDGTFGVATGSLLGAAPFISGGSGVINFEGTGNSPFGVLIAKILDAGVSVDVAVRALEQKGLARRLAEPNLIALSGQTASFLAGGEVPIPIVDTEGNADVEYKEFGVRLAFTPIVLENGQINLNLRPEVSQVDPTLSVSLGESTVPSFVTRKTETTVELRDGQSFAIAGLLQSITVKDQNQIPWIGQVPVIGTLFRSASFNKQETDLVVIVTPHIVRPANSRKDLKTPLDAARNSNDVEFFLLGMLEVDKKMLEDFENGAGVAGPFGHIIDLEFGDDYAGSKK